MALIMAKKMVVPEEMSASPTSLMLSSGFLRRFPKIQLISNNPAVCHLKEKVMPLSLTK